MNFLLVLADSEGESDTVVMVTASERITGSEINLLRGGVKYETRDWMQSLICYANKGR